MSIQFFITPYKPTEWETSISDLKIDLPEFKQKFMEKWPNAELKSTPKGGLLWSVPEERSAGFFGSIQTNLQIVSFGPGNWTTITDFIIWYREFVSSRHKLFLFNSSSWDSLKLTRRITKENIKKFVLGASA